MRRGAAVNEPLLRVSNLVKNFPVRGRRARRCRASRCTRSTTSVSRSAPARRWGWSVKSGCGKSTTGRCILRLIEPNSGEVWLEGRKRHRAQGQGARRATPRYADHLPGPVRLAEPADDGRRDHRRGADHPQTRQDARRRSRTASSSCCSWSASTPTTCGATRTNSPAASASASASPAPLRYRRN